MAACACACAADSFRLDLSGSLPARVLLVSLLSVREIFAPMAEILSENGRLEGEGDEFMRLVIVVSVTVEVCCCSLRWW